MKMRATRVEQDQLVVEGVMRFAAWLTSLKTPITVGSTETVYAVNEAVMNFIRANKLENAKPFPEMK